MSVLPMFLRLPVVRVLIRPIVARLLLLLAVVEAIFLAESFTTLMENALRYGGRAADVAILLLYKTPEIFDLALAMSLLIAVYFAVSDARNRGELVILATAGIRWTRVIAFVLVCGLTGGLLSMLNAGYLLPMANYAERVKLTQLSSDHIVSRIQEPGPQSAVQQIRDTTFIATPPTDVMDRRGQIFVFQPDVGGNWRAGQSHNWRIAAPENDEDHKFILEQLSAYEGAYPKPDGNPVFVNRFTVNLGEFDFKMADVIPDTEQERTQAERLLELSVDETPRIARLATRALMVPMAGLLALAAVVAAGAGMGRFLALPFAALLMMTGDVLGRAFVSGSIGNMGPSALIALAFLVYLGPPLAYLLWRGEALMKPDGRRT